MSNLTTDVQHVATPDGIKWHVETLKNAAESRPSTPGEYIVLIPSGEGDCHNLLGLARALIEQSDPNTPTTVITFDMPGFSRTTAPLSAYDRVVPKLIAGQVNTLLKQLQVPPATLFGCSAGGCTVLGLEAFHPERMKCGIVHEAPLSCPPQVLTQREGTDAELVERCRGIFDFFIESENDGKAKWAALGDDYFKRLEKNWVTWMRHLVSFCEPATGEIATPENLNKRPLFCTIGGLSVHEMWRPFFTASEQAGIKVDTEVLRSGHFPAVTIPEETARYVWWSIKTVNRQ